MIRATREVLSGTPDEVSAQLDKLSLNLAPHEYSAGTRLRMLAVALTQRPNLRVSLVTYHDESRELDGSQELEVLFPGDPDCEPIMIDRDHAGENCQITWDRWVRIINDGEIETAADMISSMLDTCARFGATKTPAAGVGAKT
jgi:hypothetical protein